MNRHQRGRNIVLLWSMVALTTTYGYLVQESDAFGGERRAVGIVGVMLGLYVCSHPAANAIDAMFHSRDALMRLSLAGAAWLALNLLVLVAGWATIVAGVTRLVG